VLALAGRKQSRYYSYPKKEVFAERGIATIRKESLSYPRHHLKKEGRKKTIVKKGSLSLPTSR